MITLDMLEESIRNGKIRLVTDPNMERGTVCQIGDFWFYFGGETAEEMGPEEYRQNVPEEDIAREVFDVLKCFKQDGEMFQDEYDYYEAYLREGVVQSSERKNTSLV